MSENYLVELDSLSGKSLKKQLYAGVLFTRFPHLKENLDNLHKLQVRPDDVVILANEKCGTHWVWEMTNMLLKGKAAYMDGIKEELFLEMARLEEIENTASSRILNTHLLPQFIPPRLIDGSCKLIYITRNPKDALYSYYRHNTMSTLSAYTGSFQDYFEIMIKKHEHTLPTWFNYTKAWEGYFDSHPRVPVLYLYYEDMKEDLEREIRVIATYLQVQVDEELIRSIADKCTFQNQKKAKTAQNPEEAHMYRKGEVGGWKEHFTVAMNEWYNREFNEQMKESKIGGRIRFTLK